MASGELKRAFKLFRARKFSEVVSLLEPQIFRYRENFSFYYLLGISCLYLGDFGGASSYLQRADQLKRGHTGVLLGLAIVYLKRGDVESALKVWLKILDRDPKNKRANAGINFVRGIVAKNREFDFENSKVVKKLFPPVPVSKKRIFIPLVAIVCIGLIFGGVSLVTNGVVNPNILSFLKSKKSERVGINAIQIDRSNNLTLLGKDYTYRFTDREIKKIFERAKKFLLEYRDNLAIVEINKILLSNATANVKQKASLLKTFIITPDFTTIQDSFPYKTVVANPLLYNGCFVLWRGKIANLVTDEKSISFDLLVGYEKERELEGIVKVFLSFPVLLENGVPIEVLGKVIVTSGSDIRLDGIAVHRILKGTM